MEANKKLIIPILLLAGVLGFTGCTLEDYAEKREKINTPSALVSETNPEVQNLPMARENRDEMKVNLGLWDHRIEKGEENVDRFVSTVEAAISGGLSVIGPEFGGAGMLAALGIGGMFIRRRGDVTSEEARNREREAWDEAWKAAKEGLTKNNPYSNDG